VFAFIAVNHTAAICGQVSIFLENHCDTQHWARPTHLLQCLGRLSLASPRDAK